MSFDQSTEGCCVEELAVDGGGAAALLAQQLPPQRLLPLSTRPPSIYPVKELYQLTKCPVSRNVQLKNEIHCSFHSSRSAARAERKLRYHARNRRSMHGGMLRFEPQGLKYEDSPRGM